MKTSLIMPLILYIFMSQGECVDSQSKLVVKPFKLSTDNQQDPATVTESGQKKALTDYQRNSPTVPNSGQEKAFPCPEDPDISPCLCSVDEENHLYIDCSNVTSNEELRNVFTSHFPFTDFYQFSISDNTDVTALEHHVFGNVTFERIEIRGTNISLVSEYALQSSQDKLNYIVINDGKLTPDSFPFSSLDQYTQLDYLALNFQETMDWLPPLNSLNLTSFFCIGCSVTSLTSGERK